MDINDDSNLYSLSFIVSISLFESSMCLYKYNRHLMRFVSERDKERLMTIEEFSLMKEIKMSM